MYSTGFQLDWNLLWTFCPSSPNIVRTFRIFLGYSLTFIFTTINGNCHLLLKLKPGVVLLPLRMVSAAWLIVWLFISWGDWSLLIGGSGWGTVYCCFLWPLYDSLAMENDCSANDGADKLFWGIKNFSSCYVLMAVNFLVILSVNAKANMLSASR